MEHDDRSESGGRRHSPVGGLQQALGRSRSVPPQPQQPQLPQGALTPAASAALPIIPELGAVHQPSGTAQPLHDPVVLTPRKQPGFPHQVPMAPQALLPSAANMTTNLPGLMIPTPHLPPQRQLSTQQQLAHQMGSSHGGGVGANSGNLMQVPELGHGGAVWGPQPDVSSASTRRDAGSDSGLVPLRGSLAKAVSLTASGIPAANTLAGAMAGRPSSSGGTGSGGADGGGGGSGAAVPWAFASAAAVPVADPARVYGVSYAGGGGMLAAPSAVTPLSSSFSHGFRPGLPSWLQREDEQQQQRQQRDPWEGRQHPHGPGAGGAPHPTAQPLAAPQQPHPQPPQPAAQPPQLPLQLPLPQPQPPQSLRQQQPKKTPFLPVPQPPRSPHAGGQQGQQQARLPAQGSPAAAAGGARSPHRQDSPEDPVVFSDGRLTRSTSSRGRSGIPRVASISEIEPVVESDEPRQRASSLLTRAIMIPNSQVGDRPRTYRVAPAKSQGSQDDVTVVLEGADPHGDAAVGQSIRGGRGGGGGGGSTHGSHYSYGSSGGGGAVLGSSILPSSLVSSSFLGGLFGGRPPASSLRTAGGFLTPDTSVHGADSLPFGGRERLQYAGGSAMDPPLSLAFGSLPTSSSLLRARAHNPSAGSILNKATGGLNTKMKKSTSYQQFSSTLTGPNTSEAASLAAGGSRGRRPPRNSVNGGSDSSGAGTSAGASAGASAGGATGLGFWMRGAAGPGVARGAGGTVSDGDGALARGLVVAGRRGEPDLADLAVLATSLPASMGTWSLPRSVALATSPHAGGGGGGVLGLSRANSIASASASATGMLPGSTAGGAAAGPPTFPICLICLEVLTPEDFERGDAISLQCACKGEVSLRHRNCAIEWSHHKGDVMCDICKQGIANLPPIPAEVLAAREAARRRRQPNFSTASEPNFADYVFDCIRATWVTMIVCVLFFDMNVGQSFMAGSIAGVAFMLVSMVIAACARRARALTAARAVERAAAESRVHDQQQRRQQQQQMGASGSGGGAGGSGSGLTVPLLSAADEV